MASRYHPLPWLALFLLISSPGRQIAKGLHALLPFVLCVFSHLPPRAPMSATEEATMAALLVPCEHKEGHALASCERDGGSSRSYSKTLRNKLCLPDPKHAISLCQLFNYAVLKVVLLLLLVCAR